MKVQEGLLPASDIERRPVSEPVRRGRGLSGQPRDRGVVHLEGPGHHATALNEGSSPQGHGTLIGKRGLG